MTPTEELVHEHKIIMMILDAAEREAQRIQETGKVDGDKIEKMLDFFRNFADKCHHAKEEGYLFKLMEERGMPKDSGPIAVMLHEHDLGRMRLRAVSEALPQAAQGDQDAIAAVHDNLMGYARMLREHIAKEDSVLYPMANRLLAPEDQARLEQAFAKVESEEIGEGIHEKYHELAHELAGV